MVASDGIMPLFFEAINLKRGPRQCEPLAIGTWRRQLRDRERKTSINGFGILIFAKVNFIALYSGKQPQNVPDIVDARANVPVHSD